MHQDPGTPQETEPDLPLSVEYSYGGTGRPWPATGTGALGAAYLGGMACEPPHRATEQTTHKLEDNYTKKFLHCCKSSRAHNRFPNPGIRQRDWELSGNLTFKANGIWLQNFHRTGETDSWRARTKACAYQDLGERRSDPLETEPDLPVSVQECLAKMWVNSGLLWGQGHWTVLAYVLLKEVTITWSMN